MSTNLQTRKERTSVNGSPRAGARGVAGFDFAGYNHRFVNPMGVTTGAPPNDAADKGVQIKSATVSPGQQYWKVVGIHHLTPDENQRRHNAFIEALDGTGNRLQNPDLRVGWIWEGKNDGPADPKRLDKPTDEPAADVPLEKNMTVTLWLEGAGPSDQVFGLHTRHPDEPGGEGSGNTWGHHSYYIVFQQTRKASATDPGDNDDDTSTDSTLTGPDGTDGADGGGHDESETGTGVTTRTQARLKIGIDANAPVHPQSGTLADQVGDPRIIAATGVGWVRLNFVRGPWGGPTDATLHNGQSWAQAYRQIVDGLRGQGLRIYGLVGHEILGDPGDQFRDPVAGPLSNDWIGRYAAAFAQVAELFHEDVTYLESFNEPDDWHGSDRNWVHPDWFAVMLQAVSDRVRAKLATRGCKLVSGPVQGFDNNNNAGVDYLRRTYAAGKRLFQWGEASKPIPFDGVGYHLYIAEGERQQVGAALAQKYAAYMGQMRAMIQAAEGQAKAIFISEIGWPNPGGLEREQAAAMQSAFKAIIADPAVALGIWFCTQDFPGKPYGVYQAGSLNTQSRKPIFTTLQSICEEEVDMAQPEGVSHPVATTLVDGATYVADSDFLKDNTQLPLNHPFAQSWELRNTGTTTWGPGYKFAWVEDANLGAPAFVDAPACAPGAQVRITVPFRTPQQPGHYKSTWRLVNAQGDPFGNRVWTEIEVIGAAAATRGSVPRATPAVRSPMPASPIPGTPLAEADPELYAAWREHMHRGFENNQTMFEQVLTAFMNPYWTTVWMYRILFGVGVAAFVVAALVALLGQGALNTAIFGGLSVAAFVGYFLNRPLQALEENLQFITWLGVIYNTYWTRLAYIQKLETVQEDLEATTDDTIAKIKELMDKHTERNSSRPVIGR
ncbi:MAG: NBR1-Ig-like domain-containing protein [Caldilineaceae bacterium]